MARIKEEKKGGRGDDGEGRRLNRGTTSCTGWEGRGKGDTEHRKNGEKLIARGRATPSLHLFGGEDEVEVT